jgi:membrane protease YdiL (CAAX protease family)
MSPRPAEAARLADGRYVAVYPFALFGAWVVAWIVNLWLRPRLGWDTGTDTIYWIVMKVLVWVLPTILAIRVIERRPVAEFMELRRLGRGLLWGLGIGAVLVAVNYFGKTLPSHAAPRMPGFDLTFLNAVAVAPLVEEITLRGFLLKRLELSGRTFWIANGLTTIVFVAMHVPGWYFKGRGTTSFVAFIAPMVPLAVLSLLFGWTKKRSGSLYGAIVLHAINNLYSAFYP